MNSQSSTLSNATTYKATLLPEFHPLGGSSQSLASFSPQGHSTGVHEWHIILCSLLNKCIVHRNTSQLLPYQWSMDPGGSLGSKEPPFCSLNNRKMGVACMVKSECVPEKIDEKNLVA